MITEDQLDDTLYCVETLTVCSALLGSNNMTDDLARSISWLLDTIAKRLTQSIILMEQVATEQNKLQAEEVHDEALIIASEIVRLQEWLGALRGLMNGDSGA